MKLNVREIDQERIRMVMYVLAFICGMSIKRLTKKVELKGVDYSSFKVPPCRQCEAERREKLGIVKPNVVFFVCLLSCSARHDLYCLPPNLLRYL